MAATGKHKRELDKLRAMPSATALARSLQPEGVAKILTLAQRSLNRHEELKLQLLLGSVLVYLNETATTAAQAERAIARDDLVMPDAVRELIARTRMVEP